MTFRTMNFVGIVFLSVICSSIIKPFAFAQDNKESKEIIIAKEVEGVVSGLSSRFIAVEVGFNSEGGAMKEMAFNIDKNVTVSHKTSLSDIKMGDTVKLSYGEIYNEQNGERVYVRRQLLTVIFLKAAEAAPDTEGKLQSATAASSDNGSDTLKSAIRLKGMKGE
jgi:hypothetical protein